MRILIASSRFKYTYADIIGKIGACNSTKNPHVIGNVSICVLAIYDLVQGKP
jgi:hypothetical protein